MANSTDLFDSDMIETTLVNYNPRKGIKNKIPWVDKYRPKKLDDIVQQDEVIKVLKESLVTGKFPHMLFFGSPGTGKCLGAGTLVIMYDGTVKKVEDVKKGDFVMGDDSRARRVLGTTSGEDKLYQVMQKYGDDYVVNSEHILSLKVGVNCAWKWSNKERLCRFLWLENHNIREKLFLMGESTRIEVYDAIAVFITEIEKNGSLNKVGEICDISVKDYQRKCSVWKSFYLGFKNDCITCWEKKDVLIAPYALGYWLACDAINDVDRAGLEEYGLLEEKHVPVAYKMGDELTRRELLNGYQKGIGEKTGVHKIAGDRFRNDIIFVARSLGWHANTNYIGRQYVSFSDGMAHMNNYKIKVRRHGTGQYYGFELDGNGRFLLGDFTVTHNTSSILSFAMELFGPKIFDRRVIELNASDERGINVVRNKIITFAKSAVGNADPNYPCPPYKIIILDEADAMTMEAQSALRTVMESLSDITRFCFICNYINQIIDPIASRCMKFRFKSIDSATMISKLKDIANKENFVVNDDVLDKVIELAKGDIRCGIITLQYLKYIYDYQGSISVKDIYETTNYLPIEIIKNVWTRCINLKNASIQDVKREALFLKQKGYSMNSILEKLNQLVIYDDNLPDNDKALIALNMAKTEKRLIDGADEYIQLLNSLAFIQRIYKEKN
ncbi:MAG: replication factor C small subunit [Hyperionvirus sp.]|uniref:Replication factor C small subunit n=1 Tax=Hyperionvirus sp. TaxID=2487770 RepID=A0A3G5A8I0_9VIRU|nr:MAG: replication factor C small subunit [Hyperionvirus sp.]